MSGGFFNYKQRYVSDLYVQLEGLLDDLQTEEEKELLGSYSEDTLGRFREAVRTLKVAYVLVHRIDWLLSNDDSESDFHRKLQRDLRELWEDEPGI